MFVFRPVTCPLTLSGDAVVLRGQSSPKATRTRGTVCGRTRDTCRGREKHSNQIFVLLNIFESVASALLPFLPFTIEHILNAGLCDYGVITFEPLVFVLADEACVVAAL